MADAGVTHSGTIENTATNDRLTTMKRRLFAHERELQSWRSLTLTTHRIIYLEMRQGFDRSTSILLPHLQWTRIERAHTPLLLALAGLFVLLAMLAPGRAAEGVRLYLLVAAGLTALIYLGTRRAVLVLAAGAGRVELAITSTEKGRQQARDFLDAVEDAAGRTRSLGHVSVSA